jgi:hypothetical protein
MDNKANLFIVGAAKCGTTSLHSILSNHPDIFMSKVKEPHFFSDVYIGNGLESSFDKTKDYHTRTIKNPAVYHSLFSEGANCKYRGEASPSYLWDEKSAERIYNYNQDTKIVIILRDPIKRCLSHYQMDISNGVQADYNYYQGIQKDYQIPSNLKRWGSKKSHLYVELGMYYSQVQRYYSIFPEKQILIITTKDLKDIGILNSKIGTFLSLDNSKSLVASQAANTSKVPRLKIILKFKNTLIFKTLSQIMGSEIRQNIKGLLYKEGYSKIGMIQKGEDFLKNIYREEMDLLYKSYDIDFRFKSEN